MTAFGGQDEESRNYDSFLKVAEESGIRSARFIGASRGFIFVVIFSFYGLAFYYGGTLVITDEYSVGNLLLVLFNMIFGNIYYFIVIYF